MQKVEELFLKTISSVTHNRRDAQFYKPEICHFTLMVYQSSVYNLLTYCQGVGGGGGAEHLVI